MNSSELLAMINEILIAIEYGDATVHDADVLRVVIGHLVHHTKLNNNPSLLQSIRDDLSVLDPGDDE